MRKIWRYMKFYFGNFGSIAIVLSLIFSFFYILSAFKRK